MAWQDFNTFADMGGPISFKRPATQLPKKGFLLDQISTAGGILGGIGGSFVAPLAGTAVGSAAGSALGEALENAITGDNIGKNVGKEALLGGIFGAGPIKLAKAGLSAAKGARPLVRTALSSGRPEVLSGEVLSSTAPRTSAQGKLVDAGNKLLTSQYGTISKPIARATKPEETFGKLADYGLTKPEDVERIASKFTGSNGLVSNAVLKAVGKSSRVPTDGIQQVFDDAVELNGLVDKDAQAVRSVFRAQMKRLMGGPSGSLQPDASPNDVLDVMKALEKRAANLTGKGGNYRLSTPERVDQAKALLTVRDELQERLFQAANVNKSLSSVLSPEFRESLISLQPGNAQWQRFVDNTVMKSKDIGALRSSMAPFVRAGQIIDEADINSMTFGGRAGNALNLGAGNLISSILNPVAGVGATLVQSAARNPVARAAGSGLRSAGRGSSSIVKPGGRPSPVGIGARLGLAGALAGATNQVGEVAAAGMEPQGLDMALQDSESQLPPRSGSSNDPFAVENLQQSVQQIFANGGSARDAKEFVDLATAIQKATSGSSPSNKLTSVQQKDAVRAQNALNDIDVVRNAINQGGINKTIIPGSGTAVGGRLLGTTDIESALYNIGDVILRNRTGATAPPEEVKKFVAGLLPRGGESKESQFNKLDRAYRELLGMLDPPAALSSDTPATLEQALLGGY